MELDDGSAVTYAWYRFVDQPALQDADLTAAEGGGQIGDAGVRESVVATVTVGTLPDPVMFDGSSIWVASQVSGTVSRINPNTNAVSATSSTR